MVYLEVRAFVRHIRHAQEIGTLMDSNVKDARMQNDEKPAMT